MPGRLRRPGEKSYLERLLGVMGEPLSVLDVFLRDYVSKAVAGIAMYASNPPTGLNHAEHRASIDMAWQPRDRSCCSLRTLRATCSLTRRFLTQRQKYRTNSVNVVHVAPPYNSLRGPYLLADIDLVIKGLNAFGWSTVPDANMNLPFSRKDPSGHGFRETYLDPDRPVQGMDSEAGCDGA